MGKILEQALTNTQNVNKHIKRYLKSSVMGELH